jgi:hypothetical protein
VRRRYACTVSAAGNPAEMTASRSAIVAFDDATILHVEHREVHAGPFARGLLDGFGDRECVAPSAGRIESMANLSRVDRDIYIEPGATQEDGDRKFRRHVFCDELCAIHIFAEMVKRTADQLVDMESRRAVHSLFRVATSDKARG